MNAMKRLEIVIDKPHLPALLSALDKAGVPGYTVVPIVEGKGNRGVRSADEISGVLQNSYVLIACEEELAPKIHAAIRPLLKRYGGMCLTSDCQWLIH
jgi:nitrogen regulatory protein P-II 1